ncbi:hypothetical protein [Tenacibaculum aestuariivivum]|uniref:hypothetical protein n=1 Tax=Tenacibaculum aestuariivivum TaxID=2006131 RepID=UPI003AB3AA49
MKFGKILFDFYINSSIHVALAVYSFARITEFYFGLSYNEPLDFFLFYSTITGYNFIKYAGVAKLHHQGLTMRLKLIQIFSLICFLLMCFYACKLHVNTLLFFFPFGVLTFLYAIPFLSRFQKNLRSIGYLKIIIVAFVWMGTTVFLPFFDAGIRFSNEVYLIAIQRFLFVIVLILPFDIRDLKYDAIYLQTIPRKIGVKQTKKLGYILLINCLFLEFIVMSNVVSKNIFLFIFSVTLILLMRSSEKRTYYYSAFFVELVPIMWCFFLMIIYT